MTKLTSLFASSLMLSLLLSLPSLSHAQSFERKVFSSGSSQGSIGLINYDFTFGEAFIGPTPSALPDMTMGFHQPIPTTVLSNHLLTAVGNWQRPVAHLEWSVHPHIIGSRFLIHRAVDGGDFVSLGEVEGNQQSSQGYIFDDLEASRFEGRQVWYKISWMSPSGQVISSDLVEIWIPFGKDHNWELYPNPASDLVMLRLDFTDNPPFQLRFYNALGQSVKEVFISEPTSLHSISLTSLPSGTYLVRLHHTQATNNIRLVISR